MCCLCSPLASLRNRKKRLCEPDWGLVTHHPHVTPECWTVQGSPLIGATAGKQGWNVAHRSMAAALHRRENGCDLTWQQGVRPSRKRGGAVSTDTSRRLARLATGRLWCCFSSSICAEIGHGASWKVQKKSPSPVACGTVFAEFLQLSYYVHQHVGLHTSGAAVRDITSTALQEAITVRWIVVRLLTLHILICKGEDYIVIMSLCAFTAVIQKDLVSSLETFVNVMPLDTIFHFLTPTIKCIDYSEVVCTFSFE
jgi:hypothetical protein